MAAGTFTLHHLILSCMVTAICVSILITSLHSQWHMAGHSYTPPLAQSQLFNTDALQQQAKRTGLQQVQLEVECSKLAQTKGGSSPAVATMSIAPQQQLQCAPCPSPPAATPTTAVAVSSGSSNTEQAFQEYIALHKAILAREPGVEQKFIVARPHAQMNNRLRVIVGGIALGMLTKRAFLIEFSEGYYASLSDVFDPPIQMDLRLFDQGRIGSRDSMNMEDYDNMLCVDYNERYKGAGAIELGTPPNLIPFFWRNAFHHDTLKQWFGVEEHAYRTIAQRFLKPSLIVQGMIDKFRTQNGWDAAGSQHRTRLGIHLRWGGDHRPQPVQEDEWADMVNCAYTATPTPLRSSDKLDIFVAADTPESRERAQKDLQQRFPQAKLLFYETWLRSNTPGGVQAALTELLLLSQCDHLILTPMSSYGEQAMALNGKPGYYVKSNVPNPARIQFTVTHEIAKNCLRPYSTQPTIENFSKDIQRAKCYHPDMQAISF